jgi:hypothetical protein
MTILIQQFKGLIKRVNARLLSPEYATVCENCWFEDGGLAPVNKPSFVAALAKTGVKAIYRFGQNLDSTLLHWFHWDAYVSVAKAQITGDTEEVTIWTGDGPLKYTTASLGTAGVNLPSVGRPVALPGPITAPAGTTVVGTGAGTTTIRRVYAYTFVGDMGFIERESQPSPLFQIDALPDQHVALTGLEVATSNGEPVTARRLYRSEAGVLLFVAELDATSTTFTDTATSADLAGNGEIPSRNWSPPPADLAGLVNMPNGMAAGFAGYTVWLCEPYRFYAWPYSYPVDYTVVAVAPFAQSLAVLTTGTPYVLTGTDPGQMSQEQTKLMMPCMSRPSVVQAGDDVLFAGADGLCVLGASTPGVLTADVFTPEQWRALRPETMVGALYQGHYVGTYDPGTGRRGFAFHLASRSWTDLPEFTATAFFTDKSRKLFCAIDDDVWQFRGDPAQVYTGKWRSRLFVGGLTDYAASRVQADSYPVTQRVFADGALRDETAATDNQPFKLAAGDGLASAFQLELEFVRPVQPPLILAHNVDAAMGERR